MLLWHCLESEPDNNFWEIGVNTVKALKAKTEWDNNTKKQSTVGQSLRHV